jgi:hypothetical protein
MAWAWYGLIPWVWVFLGIKKDIEFYVILKYIFMGEYFANGKKKEQCSNERFIFLATFYSIFKLMPRIGNSTHDGMLASPNI